MKINIDKKTLAIIILSIALLIVGYIAFKPSPVPYDKELIEKQIKELQAKNDALLNGIVLKEKENAHRQETIDSLQSLKPKIQTKYVYVYKEIDNANVGTIVNEFECVFAKGGIK